MFLKQWRSSPLNADSSCISTITADTVLKVASLVTSRFQGALFIPTRSMDYGIDVWNKVYEN